MMPIPRNEPTSDHARSKYRLLYVGRDADWFRRLKSALGLPANRLVYCAGANTAKLFIRCHIRYDLFLFDLDLLNETGLELVRLVRSLSHRQDKQIIIVGSEEVINPLKELARSGVDECLTKTPDAAAAVETILRLLGEDPPGYR